jgi:hypothetical protein
MNSLDCLLVKMKRKRFVGRVRALQRLLSVPGSKAIQLGAKLIDPLYNECHTYDSCLRRVNPLLRHDERR